MRKLKILNSRMMKNGLKSAGLLVLTLAGAVFLMGQGLPKGPTWDKSASQARETKQPKVPVASPSMKAGSSGIEVRQSGSVSRHKTLKEAIAAAGSSQATLCIPPGSWTIAENLLLPPNISLKFERGAILDINKDVVVTINGEIDAGFFPIFNGEGSIQGNIQSLYIYPQWWGAQGNGSNDDYEAISKAVKAATSGRLYFKRGIYLTSKMIILPDHIFIDCDPQTIIEAVKPMECIIAVKTPNYGIQQFTLKNMILDGNNLAENCLKLYKISMNNFVALEGIWAKRAVNDGVSLQACQGGSFGNITATHNGGHGISVEGCNAAKLYAISSVQNKKSGIRISSFKDSGGQGYGGACTLAAIHSEQNSEHGVEIINMGKANTPNIEWGWIEGNAIDGIRVTNSEANINGVKINGQDSGGGNFAIHLISGKANISGCVFASSNRGSFAQVKDSKY